MEFQWKSGKNYFCQVLVHVYIHTGHNLFTDFEPNSLCHHITQGLQTLCPLSLKGNVHCTVPFDSYLAK